MTLKKIFAGLDFLKTEELDDGTLKVWGYASSEAVDADGETVTAEAMKAALPDYLKFGAVREMHQPIAAGTAIEAAVKADGRTWFGAHIVDAEAVRKVKAGVYKGFSIGGKVTARDADDPNVITGLKLVEISLVDRPANPEAVLTMFKADLAKASPRFSPAAKAALKAAHDACRAADRALSALGYDREENDEAKDDDTAEDDRGDAPGEGANRPDGPDRRNGEEAGDRGNDGANAPRRGGKPGEGRPGDDRGHDGDQDDDDEGDDDKDEEELARAATARLKKRGEYDALFKALTAERDALKKRVKELEALPLPGKALIKAVGKAEDRGEVIVDGDPARKVAPVVDAKGAVNEIASLIKSIHRSGAA